MSFRESELENLPRLDNLPGLSEVSYDFYGITVGIRSNVEEVVNRFNKSYNPFRKSHLGPPRLEITVLAANGDPGDAKSRQIYARFPAGFDLWKGSWLRWLGLDVVPDNPYTRTIQEVKGWVDPSGRGDGLCSMGEVETWATDWYGALEVLIFSFVMNALPHLFVLHAGVVAKGDRAILLAGTSGSGKSTLTYALTRRGFRFLSDEYAIFDPVSLEVLPYPRNVNFRVGAAELFPDLKPVLLGDGPVPDRLENLPDLHEVGIRPTWESARASFLLFITRRAGAPPELIRIPPAEAVKALENSWQLMVLSPLEARRLTRDDAAAALGNGTQCYDLFSGDLDATVELVTSLVDR